jgi:hypothetical protein
MRKKTDVISAEIVPLTPTEKNARTEQDSTIALARMIEELVHKALSGSGAELQPFFGTAEVSYEIKRRQTVPEQKKFTFYFEDWGCMICGSREAGHESCGMCGRCYQRVKMKLRRSLQKREPAKHSTQPRFVDAVSLAREALLPSAGRLSPKGSAQMGFIDTVKLAREAPEPSLEGPEAAAKLEWKRAGTRAKQRAAMETLWADPKFRARMREARNRKRPAS